MPETPEWSTGTNKFRLPHLEVVSLPFVPMTQIRYESKPPISTTGKTTRTVMP